MSTLKVNKIRDNSGSTDAIVLDPSGGAVLAGVTTVSAVKVGSGVTISSDGDVFTTGITTSSSVIVGSGVTISESGIEASGIGITCANINGTQIGGRRNLIINGAMQVAQRGTSSTVSGYATLDRFLVLHSGTDESPTQEQVDVASGTTPYTLGFRKALKITNGNQTSGAATSDYILINYKCESRDIANSGWNYTDPNSFITFSFWVKSSVAQNFYVRTISDDTTKQRYAFETGSLTADTWTKVIKTIPGNSNLVFNNDNGIGLYFRFYLYRGTDHTDNAVNLNQWETHNSSQNVPDVTSTWYTTNDATFEMTGVQLEVGSQATAFEHRSFGDELTLCKRYCRVLIDTNQTTTYFAPGYMYTNTSVRSVILLDPEMRTTPTIVCTSATNNYRFYRNGTYDNLDDFLLSSSSKRCAHLYNSTDMSGNAGHAGALYITASSTGFISLEAEL